MPLQATDEHLLADGDTARGLFGPDAGAGDEACDGGVPGFGLAGSEAAGVVEAEGVERPFAEGVSCSRARQGGGRGREHEIGKVSGRSSETLKKSKTH